MKKQTRDFIIGFMVLVIFFLGFTLCHRNGELQKKEVKILFEDQDVVGTNIGPGKCIFTIENQKYFLSINTDCHLKYVDMDNLSTKDTLPDKKDVWYRIHEITTRSEVDDMIQIEFSKIEKSAPSCAQRIATIKKFKDL